MTASIQAYDFGFQDPSTGDTTVTIAAGGTASFSDPSGNSAHNVDFTDGDPTSCTQTAGPVLGPVPPLPAFTLPKGWAGTCTFNAPGTYSFVCDAHPQMVGTVVVMASATPTPTPTATA